MKKIIILLCVLFTGIAVAETIDITWYNEDGTTYDTTTCNAGDTLVLPTAPTKRGYTFQGWVTYRRIEYLESTGTQWIDTGYTMISNIVEYGVEVYGAPSNNAALFGSETSSGVRYSGVPYSSNNRTSIWIGASTSLFGQPFPASQWNTFIIKTTSATAVSVILNGSMQNGSYSGGIQGNRTIYLFANNNSANNQKTKNKIKHFYIKDNNIIVRDFIPVLDPNGLPCMYDQVTDRFFYNSGTDDFIAGPVVGE